MNQETAPGWSQAPWPVVWVEADGTARAANAAATRLLGPGIGSGPALETVWAPDNAQSAATFRQGLRNAAAGPQAIRLRLAGGGVQAFLSALLRDPSQASAAAALQLLPLSAAGGPAAPVSSTAAAGAGAGDTGQFQKQKLDCALQLARTVALDFNNALTSILGHTSLVLGQMPAEHPWRSSLIEVEKSAEKAAEIANDLASFSRQERESSAQEGGNLNDLLRRTVDLFRTTSGAHLQWELKLEARIYSVTFDEAKLQQALVKVIENAVQALPRPGRVRVGSRNQTLQAPQQDANARLSPGAYVCVEVIDDGPGIAPEVLPRVFEPFFTTKDRSKHRGLGLAWVYGIVTNHGGGVAISSPAGAGTSVRLYLPAQPRLVRDVTFQPADLAGNQTLLLVDDEELVLTMGRMILSSYGYRVYTAEGGAQALALFRQHAAEIDLVITDLVMPGMSGRELIEHLRAENPRLRIVCSSGYARSAVQESEEAYLKKPFTSQDLLRKVKQALAGAALDA